MFHPFLDKIKARPILYFFTKLFIFLLLVFAIDFGVGQLLSYFYFKQKSGVEYRTTYSINKTKEDILIFGSSRANHHYHPDIFESRLHMSYYNAGRDGTSIIYHYALLKGVLKRYSPKIIILDIVNKEFQKNADSYEKISPLLPYYNSHPEIRSIVQLRSRYEKYKLFSKIYPFNSAIFKIAMGNAGSSKKGSSDVQGYIPFYKVWDQPITKYISTVTYETDNKKIECYEQFIKDCNKAGVKLFVFVSPYYGISGHVDYSFLIADSIAKKHGIPFFDYSNTELFMSQRSYFADIRHLNDEGAKVYSNIVIDSILKRQ